MAQRAKITFFPKTGTTAYCLDKIQIIEKYSNWKYNTDDFVSDGYIYTDNETSINTINSNYWVKFKAIQGYKIVDCHKTNSGGTSNMGDFTINSDGTVTVYPWNSGTATIVNNYLFFAIDVDTDNKHEVTTNLTNCTSDSLAEYEDNTQATITLQANEKCLFDSIPVVSMNGDTLSFTLSEDCTQAYITITVVSDITITGIATEYHSVITTLVNCSVDKTVVKDDDNITITANTGYVLNSNVSYKYNHITHSNSHFSDDGTTCTINISNCDTDVTISCSAVKKTEKLSKFVNLYQIDNDTLTKLSKVRFYDVGSTVTKVDYGTFISNLYILPIKLDESIIADVGSIQLGNYDTGVNTGLLMNYEYVLVMGSITVPEKYNNLYDYKETTCILHLPYCENINLNTEYVVNHTITISYKIELYTGKCIVNVVSDFTGESIVTKSFDIGSKIPFMQTQNNTVVSDLQPVLDNGVRTAFIEVVRNIPYNTNSIFGNETVDFGTLENYKGYLKVSDVLLNINATNDDKNEIENLLKNGVYINEKIVDILNE